MNDSYEPGSTFKSMVLAAALAPLPASPSYMLLKWYEWGGSYHLVDAPVNILTVLPLLQLAAGTGLCLACFLRRRNRGTWKV